MILLDLSGTIHSSVHAFSADLKKSSPKEMEGIIRHVILNSILNVRKKFKRSEYGDLVICLDARTYWRRDIFPFYKATRKKARDESDLDWDAIFQIMNILIEDIKIHFSYNVVVVDKAEADDIIAVLCKYTQTNELKTIGFETESQKIVIVSEDLDFIQLQKYPNVQQYLPRKKKLHDKLGKKALEDFIIEHIVKAGDDGIPSIMCDDDHFIKEEKVRAKPISSKRLQAFKDQGRDECTNDVEKRNWDRNSKLIDFDHIPDDISELIVDTYRSSKSTGDHGTIFNYLVKNGCRQLLDHVQEF